MCSPAFSLVRIRRGRVWIQAVMSVGLWRSLSASSGRLRCGRGIAGKRAMQVSRTRVRMRRPSERRGGGSGSSGPTWVSRACLGGGGRRLRGLPRTRQRHGAFAAGERWGRMRWWRAGRMRAARAVAERACRGSVWCGWACTRVCCEARCWRSRTLPSQGWRMTLAATWGVRWCDALSSKSSRRRMRWLCRFQHRCGDGLHAV